MSPRPLKIAVALLVSSALTLVQAAEACAPGSNGGNPKPVNGGGKAPCPTGSITINKQIGRAHV